jgi:hypothetical protein
MATSFWGVEVSARHVKGPSRGAQAFFPISLPAPPAAERVDRLHDVVEAVKQGADGLAAVLLLLGVVLEGLGLKVRTSLSGVALASGSGVLPCKASMAACSVSESI